MDNHGNLNKDEVIAAVVSACAAGILSMTAWYLIGELVEEVEAADQFISAGRDIDLDDIEEGMEASSEQTKAQSTSLHSRGFVDKTRASSLIAKTMSSVAASLGKIAEVLDRNKNTLSIDNLYEEVMKIKDFDDELLVEALEYVASDDKKARTFFTLNEKRRKIWLLKHLRGQIG